MSVIGKGGQEHSISEQVLTEHVLYEYASKEGSNEKAATHALYMYVPRVCTCVMSSTRRYLIKI